MPGHGVDEARWRFRLNARSAAGRSETKRTRIDRAVKCSSYGPRSFGSAHREGESYGAAHRALRTGSEPRKLRLIGASVFASVGTPDGPGRQSVNSETGMAGSVRRLLRTDRQFLGITRLNQITPVAGRGDQWSDVGGEPDVNSTGSSAPSPSEEGSGGYHLRGIQRPALRAIYRYRGESLQMRLTWLKPRRLKRGLRPYA